MRRLISINFIAAIIGLILGFVVNHQFLQPTVKPKTLPLPGDFLSSSILSSLYANADGKVIAKTNDSFTIKKGPDTLVLSIKETVGITTFMEKTPQGFKNIKFQDVKVGDEVKGGISITLQSSPTRRSDEIIAHSFIVTHK